MFKDCHQRKRKRNLDAAFAEVLSQSSMATIRDHIDIEEDAVAIAIGSTLFQPET